MPKLFLLNIVLLFLFQMAIGNPLPIRKINIEQGLSNNSVRSIFQDHNGFMWFGTFDGLCRYDGYQFKVFHNKLNDTNSLPHNYIYTLNEDAQKRLWVGTGQGVVIYNPITESFQPVYFQNFSTNKLEKLIKPASTIQTDLKGNTFIGTNGNGLLIQLAGSTDVVQVPFTVGNITQTEYFVTSISIYQSEVWLFINNAGLCRYNHQTKKIDLVDSPIKVEATILNQGSRIWIGSSKGLHVFNKTTGFIEKSYLESENQLTSQLTTSLAFDHQGKLWIGTEGGGIDVLTDTATSHFEHLQPLEQEYASLSSKSVLSLFIDRQNRKWIGTVKGGINVIDPEQSPFRSISHSSSNKNSLINNFVSCFEEEDNENLLIGTDGGGISIWNRQQSKFTNYSHQAGKMESLSNDFVTSIRKDTDGNIWIATYGGGINRFNPQTGFFKHYACYNTRTSKENENVWLLYKDRQLTLWATTFSQGALYRYNRSTDQFDLFATPGAFDLVSFTEDYAGRLWAGNSHLLLI